MSSRSVILFGIAALAATAIGSAAEAGILITNDGEVFIGRISKEEMNEKGVVVRWPHGETRERGKLFFPTSQVRWCDRDNDEPSVAYWKKFPKAPLLTPPGMKPFVPPPEVSNEVAPDVKKLLQEGAARGGRGRLSMAPVVFTDEGFDLNLRRPVGWQHKVENRILVITSDERGAEGFVPRIHVFSVRAARVPEREQVAWLRDAIRRASGSPADLRDERGPVTGERGVEYRAIAVAGGNDPVPVWTLWRVVFGEKRTTLFSGKAHARDFERILPLFEKCVDTLTIEERRGR